MRTLVVGDIHGCLTALLAVLDAAQLTDADRLITLGDYVDRGPDSRGVIDWLIARQASAGELVALRGNHDLMMVTARDGHWRDVWLGVGGQETLASYSEEDAEAAFSEVPPAHWRFIETQCRDHYESPSHLFVHATLDSELPLDEQPEEMLFWERCHDVQPHCSGKIMICGHTAQKAGLPLNLGHAVCIDTCAYHKSGWLTCLDVDSGRYWQANQAGATREGTLLQEFNK